MPRTKKEHIISEAEKNAADLQIKKMQKQIDYDTRDFTIELLISKFEKKSSSFPPIKELMYGNLKIKLYFWNPYFLDCLFPLCFLQIVIMVNKK